MTLDSTAKLTHDSPVPLYTQLKEYLRSRILDGTFQPGSRMGSESELGATFGVSRITVRQALGDLQMEGLIFKIHGKGTFVSKPKAFQNVTSLKGLAEALADSGYEVVNRLCGFDYVPADATVAQRLQLSEGDTVLEIQRVRLVNREPVSLEITYLPEPVGRRLASADLATRDIFLILENDLDISLGHADLAIDAIEATAHMAAALGLKIKAPIMRIERLTHTAEEQPLDFEYLYYRGDAFQYRLRIDR